MPIYYVDGNKNIKKIKEVCILKNGQVIKTKIKSLVNNAIVDFIKYFVARQMIYNFPESTSSSRSITITLDNLLSVDNVTVDTGKITSDINGNNITLKVSGGTYTSRKYDSTKYSKYSTDYKTNSTDSFPSLMDKTDGDYSGTLYKNGSSYVTSGSYTPSDSYARSEYKTSTSNNFPSSIYISESGYSGYIYKDGSSYVESGEYIPADSKYVEEYRYYSSESEIRDTISYSSGGYTGPLNLIGSTLYNGQIRSAYGGTVYRFSEDTRIWGQSYSGILTKPSVDTRIWKQDYSGYIYSGGYNYYYAYNVTINYKTKQ